MALFFFLYIVRANHVIHGMFKSTCEKKIPVKEPCGTCPGVKIPGQGEDFCPFWLHSTLKTLIGKG